MLLLLLLLLEVDKIRGMSRDACTLHISAFDHVSSEWLVYCNYTQERRRLQRHSSHVI
jgi:hypothetical protein